MHEAIGRTPLIGPSHRPASRIVLALTAAWLCACKPPAPEQPPPPEQPPTPAPPTPAAPAPASPVATAPPEPAEDPARCTCPDAPLATDTTASDSDDAEDDDVPEDLQARRARARKQLPGPLATRLRAALPDHRPACDVVASGPCFIRGDFDGDTRPDDAVLVRSRHNAGGIAILWGTGGSDLLGAGRHQCWTTTEQANLDGSPTATPCLEPIDVDLAWIAHWQHLTRQLDNGVPILVRRPGHPPTKHGHPAPGALGDALLLDGGDAAAALYRSASGWTLMHLGY